MGPGDGRGRTRIRAGQGRPPTPPTAADGPGGRDVDRPGRLVELSVVDLALIDRLRLRLEPGLNVLTGETGAGKSLLIDALGLALGARADTSLVRHGAETARVEALFDRVPEPLIAVREVSASGRSTARLDDATVTAARLAETTGPLVEIHGQHEQSRLLDERWQRDLLDAFGGHGAGAPADGRRRRALAGQPGRARDARRSIRARSPGASRSSSTRRPRSPRRASASGEADELRSRLAAAREGAAIARGGSAIREALDGDAGARTAAGQALREARSLARLDPRFEAIEARLIGIDADVGDIASEVRGLLDAVDNDAAAVAALEERLSTIYALERRYGDDEAAIVAHGERAAARGRATSGPGDGTCRPAGRGRRPPRRGRGRGRRARDAPAGRGGPPVGRGRRGPPGPRVPAGRVRGRGRPAGRRIGRAGDRARRRRRRLRRLRGRRGRLPVRPEPRRAGPGPREDRLGRRAVAGRPGRQAGPRDRRRHADARLRRGRCRDRRPVRGSARAEPLGARPRPPGPRRHPPAPDRGPCRRPLPDLEARARRADGHRGRRGSIARAGSSSSGRCSAVPATAVAARVPRRSRPPASSSTRPRPGGARPWPAADAGRRGRARQPAVGTEPGSNRGTPGPGDRGLPDVPARGARPRGRDHPGVPLRPRGLRGRPGHGARLGPRPGRRGALPGGPDEARPAVGSRPRADEPAAPRGLDPGLLQVRLRRRPHPGRRRRPSRPAADAAPAPGDPDRRGGRAAPRGGRRRGRPGARPPPRPRPRRAPVRGRAAHLGGAGPRSRGPLARRRLRAGHRQGRQGAARAGRGRGPRRAGDLDRGPQEPPSSRSITSSPPAAVRSSSGTTAGASPASRAGRRSSGPPPAPAWRTGSARTPSATRSRPISSRAEPTCGSSRSCSDMRVSAPRSSTRT